jgi:hypothetical protein
MKLPVARPDVPRMSPQRPLAGVLAGLSIVLGVGAFACVMAHVGGVWPFLAFPASAIAAVLGYVALGAPRSRRA